MQIILLLFILFSQLINAQDLLISDDIDIDRDKFRLLGKNDSSILIFREGYSKFHVQAFDDSLKEQWKKELTFSQNNPQILDAFLSENKINIFYSAYYRRKTEIWHYVLNENGEIINQKNICEFEKVNKPNIIETKLSDNKKQLIIYTITNENNLSWAAYDIKNKKLYWSIEQDKEELDFNLNFKQILINNQAEVFLFLEYNNRKRKKNQHLFQVMVIDSSGRSNNSKIKMSGLLTSGVKFVYDEMNNQLLAAGFVNSKGIGTDAVFYLKYNFKDSAQINIHAFDENFFRRINSSQKKREISFDNFYVKELILRNDAGLIMFAEKYIKYEYQMPATYNNDIVSNRHIDYLFENVLAVSFHPNGSLHWKEIMFKNQKTENDDGVYSSYFLMKNSRTLRLIFNDEISWSPVIYAYELSTSGQSSRYRIFLQKDDYDRNFLPEFKKSLQISSNSAILAGKRNSNLRLAIIKYP